MLKSFYSLTLLLSLLSLIAGQKYHKVRHKHNLLSLRHVNEIREAYHDYRSTIDKDHLPGVLPKNAFINEHSLRHNNKLHQQQQQHHLRHETLEAAKRAPEIDSLSTKRTYFLRNKRLHNAAAETTSSTTRKTITTKSVVSYDDEYDDEDDATDRRLNDDASIVPRNNRDVSNFCFRLFVGERFFIINEQ